MIVLTSCYGDYLILTASSGPGATMRTTPAGRRRGGDGWPLPPRPVPMPVRRTGHRRMTVMSACRMRPTACAGTSHDSHTDQAGPPRSTSTSGTGTRPPGCWARRPTRRPDRHRHPPARQPRLPVPAGCRQPGHRRTRHLPGTAHPPPTEELHALPDPRGPVRHRPSAPIAHASPRRHAAHRHAKAGVKQALTP
jgi:hypothetical protein